MPVAAKAAQPIRAYLAAAGHGEDWERPLFRPVRNPTSGTLAKPLNPTSVYQDVVRRYGWQVGLNHHQLEAGGG